MEADSHSNATVSREQNRHDEQSPSSTTTASSTVFHLFMFLFMSSWSPQYFSATSSNLLLVAPVSLAPCFTDHQWKGQPSFSQQRMSFLEPHARQCVHKNLHNSGRKCQHAESMVVGCFSSTSLLFRRINESCFCWNDYAAYAQD